MAQVIIPQRWKARRGTAAALTSADEVLLAGELCFETDTGKFKIGDGTTAWTSLAYQGVWTLTDVRRVLDLLGSTAEGDIIYKGPSGWTRLPKGTDGQIIKQVSGLPAWAAESGGGGGGGASWSLVSTTTISSATASVNFTDLSAYTDLMLICHGLTSSASGFRMIRLSTNGGSTYYSTAGDYVTVSAAGDLVNASGFSIDGAGTTAAKTIMCRISGFKLTGCPKLMESLTSTSSRLFIASTDPIDAVRVQDTSGNLTGGTIYLFGR